jgi:hypothetical protein
VRIGGRFFLSFPLLSTEKFGPAQFLHNLQRFFCCGGFDAQALYAPVLT